MVAAAVSSAGAVVDEPGDAVPLVGRVGGTLAEEPAESFRAGRFGGVVRSVAVGFDLVGDSTPNDLPGRIGWGGTEGDLEVRACRVAVGCGEHTLGPGLGEGVAEVLGVAVELLAFGCGALEGLEVAIDALAVAFDVGTGGDDGIGGLGHRVAGGRVADLGSGEGVVVASAPPPLAGGFDVAFGGGEGPAGVGEVGGAVREFGFGSGESVAVVGREARVECPEVPEGGVSGVAEAVDAEGEGIALADGSDDGPAPVLFELVVDVGDPVDPPAVRNGPSLVGFGGLLDAFDFGLCGSPGRIGGVDSLGGGGHACSGGVEVLAAVAAGARQRPDRRDRLLGVAKLVAGAGQVGVGSIQVAVRFVERLWAERWAPGDDVEVAAAFGGEGAVEGVGVVVGGEAGGGLAFHCGEDVFGGVAGDDDAAVVDRRRGG